MKSSYFGATAALFLFCQTAAQAELLPVQNATFSRPLVSFAQQASPVLVGTGWTTTGPAILEIAPGFFANVGTIVWQNPAPGAFNHIDNLISDPTVTPDIHPNPETNAPYQGAASISALTGNEFSQLLTSSFEQGKGYSLTVGVGRNYGPDDGPDKITPAADALLRLALFYLLDDGTTRQIVTSIDIHNDAATGLSATHMLDFTTPEFVVGPGFPANKQVGVLLTTVGPLGGYFNLSNVRVSAVPEPASIGVFLAGTMLLMRRRRAMLPG